MNEWVLHEVIVDSVAHPLVLNEPVFAHVVDGQLDGGDDGRPLRSRANSLPTKKKSIESIYYSIESNSFKLQVNGIFLKYISNLKKYQKN